MAGVPAYVELDWMNQESSMRNTEASTARTVKHYSNRVDTAKVGSPYWTTLELLSGLGRAISRSLSWGAGDDSMRIDSPRLITWSSITTT